MSKFFINRPIVAMVISIIMTIAGIVAFLSLPVAQYPNIVPPEIQVNTTYVGSGRAHGRAIGSNPDRATDEWSGPHELHVFH